MDIYRLCDPTEAECKLSLSVHRIFTKKDHILEHKTCFNKLKNNHSGYGFFFHHNSINLFFSVFIGVQLLYNVMLVGIEHFKLLCGSVYDLCFFFSPETQ